MIYPPHLYTVPIPRAILPWSAPALTTPHFLYRSKTGAASVALRFPRPLQDISVQQVAHCALYCLFAAILAYLQTLPPWREKMSFACLGLFFYSTGREVALNKLLLNEWFYSADKGPYNQGYGLPSGHIRLWELDSKEGREMKNRCLQNCGNGIDSWESLGQQGDQTSHSYRKSTLNTHQKD